MMLTGVIRPRLDWHKSAAVLIPFRGDSPERERNLAFVTRFWRENMPDLEVVVAEDGGSGNDPFNRSRALNIAARSTDAEVLVLVDCDYILDPRSISEAIQLAPSATWLVPSAQFHLTPESSAEVCSSATTWPLPLVDTYLKFDVTPAGGSLTVISRRSFEAVAGLDERLAGWGGEDDAFAWALNTLVGREVRFARHRPLLHLWHPRAAPPSGEGLVLDGRKVQLLKRYWSAQGDRLAMRRALAVDESELHELAQVIPSTGLAGIHRLALARAFTRPRLRE